VREVAALAGPAVLSMLSVTLMWTTDTFFVGRLGTAEQGAVGFAGVAAWTFSAFFAGGLSAVQIFVAQHVGARSPRGAGVMTWQGVYWALLAAIPVAAIGLLGEPILGALRIDPALLPHAVAYFKIRLLGAAGVFLAFAFEGYLRGVGDTRTPMFATFAANGLNILLDYLLIFGHLGLPRLGVTGAAVATIASGFLQAAILAAAAERRALREGHLARPVLPPARREMMQLARVGAPVGLQWLLDMGSWTVFTMFVARISEVQAAAHQVATAIIHISFMPGYGISIAATTLVGQYLGAGDRESALKSARNALRLAIAFMATMGVVFWIGRRDLIAIFNGDPQVVALGSRLLILAAIFQIFDATNLVLSGVLRGAGDTRFPMVASLVMAWAVFVPVTWLLCVRLGWGAPGGWVAVILWTFGLAVVLRQRFAGRRWMEKVLVQRAEGVTG
jgi:MATE family multidrug resistance protein